MPHAHRYMEKNIYSYIGHVLVVCNPFQRVPMPEMKSYIGEKIGDLPPHNYAVAEEAFENLKANGGKRSQSIIISGESGAPPPPLRSNDSSRPTE